MMSKTSLGLVSIILACAKLPAQTPEWIVYDHNNSGLPNDAVYALALEENVAWIGTANGLAKFTAGAWTVYDTSNSALPVPLVSAISIDKDGMVWIGTPFGGLARFDGASWVTYDSSNSPLPNNTVYAIAVDANNLKWITTEGGLATFDGSNWNVLDETNSGLFENHCRALALDRADRKWIGTFDVFLFQGRIVTFDNVSWTYYKLWELGMPSSYADAIVIDQNDNKWIGTAGGGLAKFDGTNWEVYTHANSGLPANGVLSLALEGETLWIGTGSGLARFAEGTWKTFHRSTSDLPDDFVYALAVDAHGNKWIGTGSGGLALYREGGVRTQVEARLDEKSERFSLSQNYPNPFNPQTTISYELPKAGVITLQVYDVLGRTVATLAQSERRSAGVHQTTFDVQNFPSGLYFYRLEAEGFVATKKMVLAR